MNIDEIDSAIKGLVREYGMPTFSLPEPTAQSPRRDAGLVGGINTPDYRVFLTAGAHARVRGEPDNLIYFIADLLYAQKHRTGLSYGLKAYSHAVVLLALSPGIVFLPVINPDGVRWDQDHDCGWRKNRNPARVIPGIKSSVGVDVNRNYDFLWKYERYFDRSTWNAVASDNPSDDIYHGEAAFSEPESRNVRAVFDHFSRIRWYMDIHLAQGVICYSWGDDDNGTDPSQTFKNPSFDGARGVLKDSRCREFIPAGDLSDVQTAAVRVAGAMTGAGVAPGASNDYAYSRSQVDPTKDKVYGFTTEFGLPTNFYPTLAEFQQNVLDVGAGVMEFCLAAADIGLG